MKSKNMDTSNGQRAVGNKSTYRSFGETLTAVNGETIENDRRLHVAKLLAMTVTEPQVGTQIDTPKKPITISRAEQFRGYTLRQERIPKKPITISPAEHLREYILRQERVKLQAAPLLKTWEDSKPCKNEENGEWRDAVYRSSAIGTCNNTCTFVLQCLENDRIMGGEPGIRAGMDQITRQDIYLRELDLSVVADEIETAQLLMKLKLS